MTADRSLPSGDTSKASGRGRVPSSSWKRIVPAPWVDCDACGWRHYPDTGRKRGPKLPVMCSSCGGVLASTLPSIEEPDLG